MNLTRKEQNIVVRLKVLQSYNECPDSEVAETEEV